MRYTKEQAMVDLGTAKYGLSQQAATFHRLVNSGLMPDDPLLVKSARAVMEAGRLYLDQEAIVSLLSGR
jgi:hypothetical protein